MAVDMAFMLVVGVLRAEHSWADAAGEVLDVIFSIKGGNVRPTQSTAACVAEKVEPSEVVRLAERILIGWMIGYGEEFGSDDLAAVLWYTVSPLHECNKAKVVYAHIARETVEMIRIT